jgi:hypothetical protein
MLSLLSEPCLFPREMKIHIFFIFLLVFFSQLEINVRVFEKRLLRSAFGPKREELTEDGHNRMLTTFILYSWLLTFLLL